MDYYCYKCTKYGRQDYYVFNPTTMRCRDLNVSQGLGEENRFCLMFDPSKSDHYTVVHFSSDYLKPTTSFFVYDSRTHKWKKSGDGPRIFCDGVFWNNSIYFIDGSVKPCCFSVADKIVSIARPPITPYVTGKKYYVMESNGHLHYLTLCLKQDKFHVDVFEMTTDNNWLISRRANSQPLSAIFAGDSTTKIELLGMIRDEKEEDSILLFHVPGKIMIYRFSDEVCEVLNDSTWDYYNPMFSSSSTANGGLAPEQGFVVDIRRVLDRFRRSSSGKKFEAAIRQSLQHSFYQHGKLQFGFFFGAHAFIESVAPV